MTPNIAALHMAIDNLREERHKPRVFTSYTVDSSDIGWLRFDVSICNCIFTYAYDHEFRVKIDVVELCRKLRPNIDLDDLSIKTMVYEHYVNSFIHCTVGKFVPDLWFGLSDMELYNSCKARVAA